MELIPKMILQNVEIKKSPILVTIAGDRYFRLEKDPSDSTTYRTAVRPAV